MKEIDKHLNEVEQLLKKVRLAEPPEELRARVVGAARETWENAPADIPWRVPLRHLGLSAAAAVLIVTSANYYSVQAVAPWQAGRPAAARIVAADQDDVPEMPYSPFVGHLIATCGSPARDATALLDYVQSIRKIRSGAEPDEAAEGSGPEEQESLKGKMGIMEHWNGGIVAGLGHPEPDHAIISPSHHSLRVKGVAVCSDAPRES